MSGYIAKSANDPTAASAIESTGVSEEALSSVFEEADTDSMPSEEGIVSEPAPYIMQGLSGLEQYLYVDQFGHKSASKLS